MYDIVSAAPRIYSAGVNDKSRRTVSPQRDAIPTFLVKVWGYAKTGPTDPQLVVGQSRTFLYDATSFDERGKYATHATALSNVLNSKGNVQMFQRVIPKDAGPLSTIRLSLDLLPTTIPEYQRSEDGSIVKDADGLPIPTGVNIQGFKARWVSRIIPDGQMGLGTIQPGTQTDGTTQSKLIPVKDLQVPYIGADGNNAGLRMYSPVAVGLSPFDDRLLTEAKVYPYRMVCLKRADEQSTGKLVRTRFGDTSVQVSFKPDAINRNDPNGLLYVGDAFIQAYQNLDDPNVVPQRGIFDTLFVYDANVESILRQVYAAEAPFADQFSDFVGDNVDEELYMFNIVGATSSKNVPYHSFVIDNSGVDTVRMSENSVFYAKGGSDGTMSEALFATLVSEQVADYSDTNSPLQDRVVNCESFVIDSGFPLFAKYELTKAISIRKDIGVILSTHDVLGTTLTAAEESSIGAALRTRLQLYPESEFYGTSVMRGMVVAHSGEFLDGSYRKRLPLTLEIAKKSADYMGAADGKWKNGLIFDSAPLSEVTSFKNVNATFKPDSVRNVDWRNSIVTAQSFKRRSVFFPALKTAYDDDTSVLNSFFAMCGCIELQKVGYRSWQYFTGSIRRTRAVLKRDVEKFISDDVKDRFDGNFVIIPEVYFTQADMDRGYSWSTRIQMGANNMTTVNSFELESYRTEDLQPVSP